MIVLGADAFTKDATIATRAAGRRIFYVGPRCIKSEGDSIRFDDAILYRHFYRWLRDIDAASLLVIDEPLRGTDRGTLHLNCIRHYAAQAGETLVFSYLPIIEQVEDYMILFDLATKSRWRKSAMKDASLSEVELVVHERRIASAPRFAPVDSATQDRLVRTKRTLVDNIGSADPHTIPRTLYLETGRARAAIIAAGEALVGRNNRLRLPDFTVYRDADARKRTVFEFAHSQLTMCDWLAQTRQETVPVLVADARVDRWYLERFDAWTRRLADAYAALR